MFIALNWFPEPFRGKRNAAFRFPQKTVRALLAINIWLLTEPVAISCHAVGDLWMAEEILCVYSLLPVTIVLR